MSLKMKYFVLNPKSKTSTDMYAKASRKAMLFYANTIQKENPILANDLREWVDREGTQELELMAADGTLPTISSETDRGGI